jgi:bifunctional UDP-N-acetylglucosamine pyrophosphorylase/glucosamine-1-phosphate N-acetyltransferase
MSDWAAVILAGGKGTRMESDLLKVLHPVCGRPMVCYVVDAIRAVHSGPIVMVVPPGMAVGEQMGESVHLVEQVDPLGTGHALLQCKDLLQDKAARILVMYADTPLILPSTLSRLIERHEVSGAGATLLTSTNIIPDGLGRIVRDTSGNLMRVVEEADAEIWHLALTEVNGGVYGFDGEWLWQALSELTSSSRGEYYLTDLVHLAISNGLAVESIESGEPMEVLGINDRIQLAQGERAMRDRIIQKWMLAGVTIIDPVTTYIDAGVKVDRDTTIHPNTILRGRTGIGKRCNLGPNSMIYDSIVGDDCKISASVLEEAQLDKMVEVGPFSHLRPGSSIGEGVHIGNYAEVKNSRIGNGTKMGHSSYLGDAHVGERVNIGAGTITCNFDGVKKNQTVIEDDAFIGSGTMLVAPLRIGARSYTGAGSVVTRDVPQDSTVFGVPAKPGSNK